MTSDKDISPYSTSDKIRRVMWGIVSATLFRPSPHPLYKWRAFLLRSFGAKVGRNVRVRPTAKIEQPWNISFGDDVSVGDCAILYALGKITLGPRTFISQYAHLCAGTHDHTLRTYPLQKSPITIGRDCWIAADAFIGPGITIGDQTVVGARSSVFKDLPGGIIAMGNPARAVKERILRDEPTTTHH